jgi:ABC-type multidrug transport system fused ATPase/permease subunit
VALLADYLGRQRWRVAGLAALLLGGTGLQLLRPQVLKRFVDAVRAASPLEALAGIALLFMALVLVEQAAQIGSAYLTNLVGWSATNALRQDLAQHVLSLDLSFHHTHSPGELIERIDGDVTTLANFFSQFVLRVLGNALLLIGISLFLFAEHWLVGTALLALSACTLLAINRIRVLAVPHWVAARATSAELAGYFEERLVGIEDIRANGAVAYKLRLLYAIMRRMYERYRAALMRTSLISNSALFVQSVGLVVGLGLGSLLFYRGELTLGSVFLISYYARLMAWPLRDLVAELEDLQQAEAGLRRVTELRASRSAVVDGLGAALPAGPLGVCFRQVSFAYSPGNTVLHDIDFELRPGQVLGLLGRTGSGKSTLTRLLFRFYDPSSGSIRLGGADLRELRLSALRQHIGLVTQEVQLIRGTIRQNLTLFDASVPDAQLLRALEELGLGEWFQRFPQGLDTPLAASGSGLSAGEAQLLAFARVFLKDPGLVILDEASSRLDLATERLIEQAVDRLLARRTGIIIAHRLATVQRVDRVLILDGGRMVEFGDRAALAAARESHFAGLLRTGLEAALA